ncbi:MAG TPA: hypothetical protein VM305_02560 [Candidatus Limnocylindrales bacterium]|nr:hypothetical protein [Candidatus Limnocylindrales bacterium]
MAELGPSQLLAARRSAARRVSARGRGLERQSREQEGNLLR